MSKGITRLATLTFADEPDLEGGWAAVEAFRRKLDEAGIEQPLIVPEYGSRGGRLHFHCAMPSYVRKETLTALWGEGFVDVRKIRVRGRRPGGRREIARTVAGYVAGYVAKNQAYESEPEELGGASGEAAASRSPVPALGLNRRRYSIPKGTRPEPVRFSSFSLFDAWADAQTICGHQLLEVWRSPMDSDDWLGPPILLLMG